MNWFPWLRTRVEDAEPDTGDVTGAKRHVTIKQATPTIDHATFAVSACRTYGAALAAAAPVDGGPLTPELLFDCGTRIGTRGRWSAVIEVADDGELRLTPFDGYPVRGVYSGSTREPDGFPPRTLRVERAALFHVELPGGAPLGAFNSATTLLRLIESALAQDASYPVKRLLKIIPGEGSMLQAGQLDEMAQSVSAMVDGGASVLPSEVEAVSEGYGPDANTSSLTLREQLRADVAAGFGLNGLLADTGDAAAFHAAWRIATVRTFNPLAYIVEREAAAKLDQPYTLNRKAWFAASHGDRARLISARAGAVSRLARDAGMQAPEALATMRELDDD